MVGGGDQVEGAGARGGASRQALNVTELPVRLFKDAAAWEAWLARQHAKSAGLWLRIAKAASNVKSVSYAEALDVALCYGWIDGQKKSFDDSTFLQKFTPRGKRSIWSKINREKVQRLVESGRMQSPGLEAVDRAKANGQWELRIRLASNRRRAGRPSARARRTPESEGVFRDAEQREPIRHPVPHPDGEKSRDAREEDRAVRRDAGAARGDPLVARASPAP